MSIINYPVDKTTGFFNIKIKMSKITLKNNLTKEVTQYDLEDLQNFDSIYNRFSIKLDLNKTPEGEYSYAIYPDGEEVKPLSIGILKIWK